jgi:serine/threonine protein kinase
MTKLEGSVESLIGTTIGGYKLERSIGSGTTGQVFEALDSVGALAAIKVLHPSLSLFTKVQTYWEEQQQVSELAHPHIVVASGADWSMSGRFYLAMDLLDGIDLYQALADHGKLSPAQVLLFVGQTCLALEAVQEIGLIHGAIKPRNILLVTKGDHASRFSTRVTDFATTHLVDTASVPGERVGNPGVPDAAYLAPEQFKGKSGPATDIYSLGVVMYEALTGRRPFAGSSFEELAQQHETAQPGLPAGFSEGLKDILLTAMAKSPGDRYRSAAELREALEAWASGSPPELKQEPRVLFPKDEDAPGVVPDGEDATVRVPMEEISAVFREDDFQFEDEKAEDEPVENAAKEHSEVAEKPQPQSAEKDQEEAPSTSVPQDEELAAIAEQAGAALRKEPPKEPERTPAPETKPAQEVEGFLDEDGDLVELPLERSVRAFVARISPTVPARDAPTGGNGNGESLDGALDDFLQDARAWNAALPPPVVDDGALADLAKVPVEPEPEPEPAPAPPLEASVVPTFGEPPPRRGVALPVILAAVVGGALVFGGMKLLTKQEPTPAEPAVTEPAPTEPAAATTDDPTTGEPTAEPTPTDDPTAEPSPTAEPAATGEPDQTAGSPLATPLADSGAPTATATPDAAPSTPTPEPKVAAKTEKPKPKIRRPRKKRPRKRPRKRPKAKKAAAKAKKPQPKKKPKPAKGGSDWVDPFSQ